MISNFYYFNTNLINIDTVRSSASIAMEADDIVTKEASMKKHILSTIFPASENNQVIIDGTILQREKIWTLVFFLQNREMTLNQNRIIISRPDKSAPLQLAVHISQPARIILWKQNIDHDEGSVSGQQGTDVMQFRIQRLGVDVMETTIGED